MVSLRSDPHIGGAFLLNEVYCLQDTQSVPDSAAHVNSLPCNANEVKYTSFVVLGDTNGRIHFATSVVFIRRPLCMQEITSWLYSWIVVTCGLEVFFSFLRKHVVGVVGVVVRALLVLQFGNHLIRVLGSPLCKLAFPS